jgi:hypothetical protein
MGRLGVCLSAGTLLMLLGGLPLLFVYAFASMSMGPHEVEGWDYWSEVLARMFNFADSGCYSLTGTVILLSGAALLMYGTLASIADAVRSVWRTK